MIDDTTNLDELLRGSADAGAPAQPPEGSASRGLLQGIAEEEGPAASPGWWPRMRQRPRLLITGMALTLTALAAVGYLLASAGQSSPAVRTAVASRGVVTAVITAAGTASPTDVVPLAFTGSGTVATVSIQVGDQVTAGQLLASLNTGTAQTQVGNAEQAVQRAQAALAATSPTRRADIQTAQATLATAQAQLALAHATLAADQLRAPQAGVITQLALSPGQEISGSGGGSTGASSPSSPPVTLAATALQVDAGVNEADLGKLHLGQSAQFTVSAYPGRTFTGTVSTVSPIGVTTAGITTYPVTISVPTNQAGALRSGMSANLTIVYQQVDNAVVIPPAALEYARSTGHAGAVLALVDGQLRVTPVIVGLTGETAVQITKGLRPGDVVATAPAASQTQQTNPLQQKGGGAPGGGKGG